MKNLKFNFKSIVQSKARWLLTLIAILTLGVGQLWASVDYVVGCAASNSNNYSVRLNVNRQNWGWYEWTMEKAGLTFEGKKLYIKKYETDNGWVNDIQFLMKDGSGTQKDYKSAYAGSGTEGYSNQIYNYDGGSWYTKLSFSTSARFYFDASTWDETSIKLVIGHANYQKYYSLSNITNTKLYYGSTSDAWGDAMHIGVVGGTSASDGTNWPSDISDKASEYTGLKNYALSSASAGNVYLMVPNGKTGQQPDMHYYATHYNTDALNSTQTIKYAVGVNGGTPATLTSGYVPADIAISSYKFSSGKYNAVDASSGSVTLSKGGLNYSATVTAARTATTTYTVSNVHEDYSFLGWYSAASGGTLLSSELSYTFYPTSATTAYARFSKENNHTVTIIRYCTSTTSEINRTSAKIGEVTYSSIEAPDIHGYAFVNWSLGSGLTKHSSDALTANPIRVITAASGTYTLTANYTEVLTTDWKLIGDNASNSPFGDNYSYASGKAMSKKSGASATDKAYKTLDITKTGTWGFKVATASGNSYTYGWGTGDGDYITFNRSKSGNQQDVYTGSQHELKFNPDGLGEYEFEVDYTAAKCSVKVTFPTVYTVTYGKGTGGNTVSASYSSTSFSSGTKVQSGKTVRFTQTASTGYQFKEWNTNSSGTGTLLSTSATYDRSVSSSNNVYAIFSPKQYAITLNDQDATTAVSPSSVNATYKSLTLSSAITNPEKDGYTFGGWYSAVGGGGYLIINTSGALQASKSGYTDATGWAKTSVAELYAKWTQVLVLDKNGGATDGGLTVVYKKTETIGHTAATRTGYTLNGYYDAESGGNKIINADGSLVSYSGAVSSYISSSGAWIYDGTPTLYAQWTAKSYDVTLKPNGATTGSDQVVRATYDATMPTQTKSSAALVAPTKTGYTLQGFYQNSNGTGTKYYNANMTSANNWDQDGNANIWAIWQANPYVVTLDVDETNQGNIEGATTSQNVSYDGATTTVPNRPTAANGYALDGYYTEQLGEGTKVINADGTWIASVAGYTDGSKHWVHDGSVTLYAYYKKAEITNIAFGAGTVVENGSTVTVTATISPTPTGTTTVCWRILYDNGSALDPQPEFDPANAQGTSVNFTAPAASGMYKVEAVLHTGSGCTGTDLSTLTADFQVAGSHTVTVQYHDGSGNSIKANTSVIARPLDWSEEAITAPDDIFGYIFERWEAGDGVTIKDEGGEDKTSSTYASIKIKASYDGTLTAVYKPADILYFKNTMGWSNVYVYFYTSDKYWDQTYYGSGTWQNKQFCEKKKDDQGNEYDDCMKPYWDQKHGQLTRLGETDIWYIDFGALGCADWHHLVFNANQQDNYEWFSATELVRRGDLSKGTPMFVPADKSTYNPTVKNGNANYYNQGYWTKYIGDKTGYTLEIYNSAGNSLLKSIPLTGDENLMPMTAKADLEGTTNYKFQIRRDNSIYYGNTGTMTYANHGQGTPWAFTSFPGMCTITTTAAGDYKFTLTYSKDGSGNYELRMAVDYPISDGDYRLVYSDAVQTKPLTSAVVPHMANKDTIVSFFIRKDQSPNLRLQKATVAGGGAITWNEYPTSGTPTNKLTSDVLNTLPQDSVYNINLHMDGSSNLSVSSVTPYEGDFYIRTDGVRNKWDNFRAADHLMTYSEYAEKNSGFTHYFMSHVYGGTSVKFVVANDYAPNISDTLVQQAGDAAHVTSSGNLWTNAGAEANIRFMWNRHDNSVGRAYLAAAKTDGSKFLVLRANSSSDMMDEDGNALISSADKGEAGYNHKAPDNQMQFIDDENWIYETTVKVLPGAYVKLYARYHGENFYYKGKDNNTFDGDNAIQILGGTGDAEKIHVVYDFKTGRLVSAWMPSGTISTERAINADVMFLREHQGDIEQLTFSNGGKITEINTAYAVMRFNKWTLNNKSKESGHDVLSPLLSNFERDLFYISFPFRVNLEEVFGFGTYGKHWIIEEYDGAGRAEKGYWADSKTFWTFVTNRKGKFLEPNTGYILALDLDELGESSSVWDNGVEQVELYFPSYGAMPTITSSSVTYEVPAHTCTIGPRFEGGDDRRVKDSHWNVLSVPTYVNTNNVSFANTTWTTAGDGQLGPNFLYTVNWNDNSLSATSGSGYTYHAMYAYIVQYCGYVTWTTSVSPATAPNRNPDAPKDAEYRLELRQNDQMVDQTFIRLSDDEHVTTGFEFNYDLSKEFNKNKANIYTMVTTQMEDGPSITETAGNCLPLTEQTTIVPVGVIAKTTGDYTFAIPEGTNGVGVTLIDNETGIRTPLSALDYTVNLNTGTYNDRFVLEISPIHHMPTDIEMLNGENGENGVRKILIDGIMYIVRGNQIFDAQGKRVQ